LAGHPHGGPSFGVGDPVVPPRAPSFCAREGGCWFAPRQERGPASARGSALIQEGTSRRRVSLHARVARVGNVRRTSGPRRAFLGAAGLHRGKTTDDPEQRLFLKWRSRETTCCTWRSSRSSTSPRTRSTGCRSS